MFSRGTRDYFEDYFTELIGDVSGVLVRNFFLKMNYLKGRGVLIHIPTVNKSFLYPKR